MNHNLLYTDESNNSVSSDVPLSGVTNYDTMSVSKTLHDFSTQSPYYQNGVLSEVTDSMSKSNLGGLEQVELPETELLAIKSFVPAEGKILFVSNGPSKHVQFLESNGFQVSPLDISKDERRLSARGALESQQDITKDAALDGAIIYFCLEVAEEPQVLLDLVFSKIKNTAKVIVFCMMPIDELVNSKDKLIVEDAKMKMTDDVSSTKYHKIIIQNQSGVIASIKNSNFKYSFVCEIVSSQYDKSVGLQKYSDISNEFGLLFQYDGPTYVNFHMGSVSFPIDIIFIDQNNKIVKYNKFIRPDSKEFFSCDKVTKVFEIKSRADLHYEVGDEFIINALHKKASKGYVMNIGIIDADSFDQNTDVVVYKKSDSDAFIGLDHNSEPAQYSSRLKKKIAVIEPSDLFLRSYKDLNELSFKKDLLKIAGAGHDKLIVVSSDISRCNVIKAALLSLGASSETKIMKNYDHFDLVNSFDGSTVYAFSKLKLAGASVPENIKAKAKQAYNYLENSEEFLFELQKNIVQNLDAFTPFSTEESLEVYKGQYHQSIKRNIELTKKCLMHLKNAISLLNEIKDISTTIQVIEAIAESSKDVTENLESIFNLIDIMSNAKTFMEDLTLKTSDFENLAEDLEANIERAKEYINSNILGIIVLSD